MTIDLCGVTLRASTTTADIAETCIPPLYLQHDAKRCNAAKAREHIYVLIEQWQQRLVQHKLLYRQDRVVTSMARADSSNALVSIRP